MTTLRRSIVTSIKGSPFCNADADDPINAWTVEYFTERGIDLGYLEKSAKIIVERGGGNCPIIHYPLPNGEFTDFWVKRLEHPPRGKGKFDRPAKEPPHLYFAPIPKRFKVRWPQILADVQIPILIAEGPVKAMAIAQYGGVAVGIEGAQNWHYKGGQKLLDEFKLISWKGRPVTLVYDADVATNENVQDGLLGLCDGLLNIGAIPAICLLDAVDGDPKTGVDDWIKTRGYKRFKKYVRETTRPFNDPKFAGWGTQAKLNFMNSRHAVVMAGNQAVVLTERDDEILLSTPTQLKTIFDNRFVGQKKLLTWWLEHPDRRTYERIVFEPQGKVPDNAYNLWRGFAVQPKRGRCNLFLDHIRKNIVGGNRDVYKYIIAWMADAVQNPAHRPGIAIALRGEQGTGKGIFATNFGSLFGNTHFVHVQSSRQLTGRFNSHLKQALILFADEAIWAGDRSAVGPLKALITEERQPIEIKGKDIFFVRNHVRLIIASNEDWVAPAGPSERRFCVLDVGSAHMQDTKYFGAIVKQMENGGREALLHRLLDYDLSGIDLRNFPKTKALWDQKVRTMTPVQRFWLERLLEGRLLVTDQAWAPLVVKSSLHRRFADDAKLDKVPFRSAETEFGSEIKKLVPGPRTKRESGGFRRRRYLFPSLGECRMAFEKAMGHTIDWEEDEL